MLQTHLHYYSSEISTPDAVPFLQAYDVLPYFGAKLAAELPVGAVFPLLFGAVVYPLTGLNPRPSR